MEPGDELKTYFFKPNGLSYYTKKRYIEEIRDKDRFSELLHSSQRIFIVMQTKVLDQLKRDLAIEICPIEQLKIGYRDHVLISNR